MNIQVLYEKVLQLFTAYNNNNSSLFKFKHIYMLFIKSKDDKINNIHQIVLFKFASNIQSND